MQSSYIVEIKKYILIIHIFNNYLDNHLNILSEIV